MRTELEELHRERSSAKVVVTRLKSVLQSALSDNQVRGTCHRYVRLSIIEPQGTIN